MEQKHNRRGFFLQLTQALGLVFLAPGIFASRARAEEQRRRARGGEGGGATSSTPPLGGETDVSKWPLVEPGKGSAVAVNYAHKHSDVKDKALKVERSGVPFEKQFCNNCGFYTKATTRNGEEVGKCQIFPNQLVKSTAWCSTWNKKA